MEILHPPFEDDWEHHWTTFGDAARENPANVFRAREISDRSEHRIGWSISDVVRVIFSSISVSVFPIPYLSVLMSPRRRSTARALVPDARFSRVDIANPDQRLAEYEQFATHGVCSGVLEHLDDPVFFLRKVHMLLSPGSPMIFTVPAGPRSAFDRFIGHWRHFTVTWLRHVLEHSGFEVERISSAVFPFFTLYRLPSSHAENVF